MGSSNGTHGVGVSRPAHHGVAQVQIPQETSAVLGRGTEMPSEKMEWKHDRFAFSNEQQTEETGFPNHTDAGNITSLNYSFININIVQRGKHGTEKGFDTLLGVRYVILCIKY